MHPSWGFLLLCGVAVAQPPLPPEERPSILGTVVKVSAADGIALESGATAPLAEGVRVSGAEGLAAITAGDLVDLAQDANGLVTSIRVLPRLTRRMPLIEAAPQAAVSRFWWTHDGRAYPDSLYGADATIPLQVAAVGLEATLAYLPQEAGEAAEFAVLDAAGTVLWSAQVTTGATVPLKCALPGGQFALRCRRADGSTPDHTHCVWGGPTVVLKELGLLPLPPSAADELAAGLEASLKGVDPGPIAVALPKVVGLSPHVARDLQSDLLIALGRRRAMVGLMPWEAGALLPDAQRTAAQDRGAAAVAVAELRYAPEGSEARASLVHLASGEVLATAEATVKP
jgi:hypothetical protein